MMPSVFLLLIGALVLGSLGCWMSLASKHGSLENYLDHEPRRLVPWGLIDVFAVVGIVVVVEFFAVLFAGAAFNVAMPLDETASTTQWMTSIACVSASRLLALIAAIVYLVFRNGAGSHDLGWSREKLPRDTAIGVVSFLLLAAPIFAIQIALTALLEVEDRHPLIEQLARDPNSIAFVLAAFTAVVAAPITEEFFFRGVLQGWLEKLASDESRGAELLIGNAVIQAEAVDHAADEFEVVNEVDDEATSGEANPYLTSKADRPSAVSASPDTPKARPVWWPIVVSSLLFAAVHIDPSAPTRPDAIPLFVLAMGLGYVYHRTHRLWPCIVIHTLLNSTSMFMLWLAVQMDVPL